VRLQLTLIQTFALAVALLPQLAHAARPFVTDDARIVDPDGYQIESYVRAQRGTRLTEFWFLPAANFGGLADRFEFTLGGNYTWVSDGGNSNLLLAQVKTLLRPLEANGFGLALTLGLGRVKPGSAQIVVETPFDVADAPAPEGDTSTKVRYNPYLNAIASVSLADDAVVLHLNAGVTRDNVDRTNVGNWGIGAEIALDAQWFGIAESYGLSGEKPAYQVGARYWAIPRRLQIDGTYGFQNASPSNLRWISVGVRVLW
jgi:hypothetical protein